MFTVSMYRDAVWLVVADTVSVQRHCMVGHSEHIYSIHVRRHCMVVCRGILIVSMYRDIVWLAAADTITVSMYRDIWQAAADTITVTVTF